MRKTSRASFQKETREVQRQRKVCPESRPLSHGRTHGSESVLPFPGSGDGTVVFRDVEHFVDQRGESVVEVLVEFGLESAAVGIHVETISLPDAGAGMPVPFLPRLHSGRRGNGPHSDRWRSVLSAKCSPIVQASSRGRIPPPACRTPFTLRSHMRRMGLLYEDGGAEAREKNGARGQARALPEGTCP